MNRNEMGTNQIVITFRRKSFRWPIKYKFERQKNLDIQREF